MELLGLAEETVVGAVLDEATARATIKSMIGSVDGS